MNKLKLKIKEEGRSQSWIAAKIGISQTTFSKFVNLKRKPNYVLAEKIAELLNCKPDDIFLT